MLSNVEQPSVCAAGEVCDADLLLEVTLHVSGWPSVEKKNIEWDIILCLYIVH